ncbi:TonB-linked outer membrane protein, SusC/RagA family [bacterium A37T11]|nr:TonB-linked outer membrane protein, SusC/RagA family [bacterium A37T11]
MLVGCLHLSAKTMSQTVTLVVKDKPLSDVLEIIEKQTGYLAFSSEEVLKYAKPITISILHLPLAQAMDKLFANQPYVYEIDQKNILIHLKTDGFLESPKPVQPRYITGSVTDSTGAPLKGATVVVLGKNRAVITADAGNFRIAADPGDKLQVSFIGYETRILSVTGSTLLNVVLKELSNQLDDIIVVGYGTQKKETVTGAVSQVGEEVFTNRPLVQAAQGLQGKIPNLNITYSDGVPDRGANFNVRGTTSINGGSPLILIDNVPGDIRLINPEDIASVTVLKDAASAAIYGGKAAFGVILVTTKNGKAGEAKVRYSNNIGLMRPTKLPQAASALDAAEIQNEAYKGWNGAYNASLNNTIDYLKQRQADPTLPELTTDAAGKWISGANIDWYDKFYNKNQHFDKQYLSVSGGTDKTKYYLSAGYTNQTGTFKVNTDNLDRYTIDMRLDQQIKPWLTVAENLQLVQSQYDSPNRLSNALTVYRYLSLFGSSYDAIYTPNGNYTEGGAYVFGSLNNGSFDNTTTRQVKNLLALRTNFFNNKLHINAEYSVLYGSVGNQVQNFKTAYEPSFGVIDSLGGTDYFSENNTQNLDHNINLYGDYSQDIGDHHFKILAGFNQELTTYNYTYMRRNGNMVNGLSSINLTNSDIYTLSDSRNAVALRGAFGRFNYDFNGKYLVEFNGRYDGTSRFPKSDRFGFFPSASAGWVLTKEKFFDNISKDIINEIKIRSSYGVLGNQALSDPYPYIQSMSVVKGSYVFDGLTQLQTSAPGIVASDLTWERAATFDVGADINALSNRFTLGFDWYQRNTTDMLTKGKTLPEVLGTSEPQENAANLSTKGWEFSLEWKDRFKVGSKPFTYTINLVLSDYKAKITKFDNPSKLLSDYYVGQTLGEIWGYNTPGFFKTDDEYLSSADQSKVSSIEYAASGHPLAGDIKYEDRDNSGAIDYGDNTVDKPGDRYVIGNTTPRYSFGANFNFDWNGFDLNVFFQGVGKRDFWPGAESGIFWGSYNRWNQPIYQNMVDNYWTPDHIDAYYPRPRAYLALSSGRSLYAAQTHYLQNAAYVRLKDVTLGYTFTMKKYTEKLGNTTVRVFFSGYNLYEWTSLSDVFDPEGLNADASNTSAGSGFLYPQQRTYTFGLDINF